VAAVRVLSAAPMAKKIVIIFGGLILLLVVIIATRPSTFTITRSMTLKAPPAVVFGLVNDFHKWSEWSPWERLDPSMKKTYEGPESGTGASYSWEGNDKVGKGKMTITASKPPEEVDIDLEFIAPFTASNKTVITLKPAGDGTDATWTMTGSNNFMSKAMSLVMDMDRMVGTDFEDGLSNLDALASAELAKQVPNPPPEAPAETADGGTAPDADGGMAPGADGGVAAPPAEAAMDAGAAPAK